MSTRSATRILRLWRGAWCLIGGGALFTAKELRAVTQTEIKREFRGDEMWNQLKDLEMKAKTDYKIVEKAAKAFEMKSNNMANINRRQIAKVEKGIDKF
jgi:heme oxygenase